MGLGKQAYEFLSRIIAGWLIVDGWIVGESQEAQLHGGVGEGNSRGHLIQRSANGQQFGQHVAVRSPLLVFSAETAAS
jgi:hypothetical protein